MSDENHPIASAGTLPAIPLICSNCLQPGTGRYCAECGQRRIEEHEWTLRHFFGHLLHEVTHLDANKILRTAKALLFQPGTLTEAYFAGRRLQFIGPIRVYLTCSAIFFLAAWEQILAMRGYKSNASLLDAITQMAAARKVPLEQYSEHFTHNVDKYAGVLWFLSVLAIAGFLRLIYRRSGRYYVQHLILALHLLSFSFLLRVVVVGVARLTELAGVSIRAWTVPVTHLILLVYGYLALRRVLGQPSGLTGVKALGLVLVQLSMIIVVIALATIIAFAIT
jgi:hypothetical protein